MIISCYSDGEKKDKIAEFYDTHNPCSFMRGLLTEAEEQEKDVQVTFATRREFMTFKPLTEEQTNIFLNNPLINMERGDL